MNGSLKSIDVLIERSDEMHYLNVCACTMCVPGSYGLQKKALDFLNCSNRWLWMYDSSVKASNVHSLFVFVHFPNWFSWFLVLELFSFIYVLMSRCKNTQLNLNTWFQRNPFLCITKEPEPYLSSYIQICWKCIM